MVTDKINGLPGSTLSPSAESSRKQGVTAKNAEAEARGSQPASTDKVALTESARQLHRLEQAVASSPETSAEKIEAIREQIERGEYRINAEAIADKLVASDTDLLRLS